MNEATLTMLVHGESGVGKSWFGDTSPAPRLILDAEGRSKYLPSEPKVFWDPTREAPPEPGEWETCIAYVPTFEIMQTVFQWLRSGQHCFRSVVVDSLMEIQKRLIDSIAGMEQLQTQDWGVVLRRLEGLVRDYRDLVLRPEIPTNCVVFTSGSVEYDGMRRPILQGQLRTTVPYYMDAVGYLYVTPASDGVTMVRQLLVNPHPTIVAKDGTNRLPGPIIQDPHLGTLFNMLNGNTGGNE